MGKDLPRSHVAELNPEQNSVSPAIKWVRLDGVGRPGICSLPGLKWCLL